MFKFFLKNMPGSPGSTAKTIINRFKQNKARNNSLTTTENFNLIIEDRIIISSSISDNHYQWIKDIEAFVDDAKQDITLFTFLILCAESQNFRIAINSDGFRKSQLPDLIKVLYEVCTKNSNLCTLNEEQLYESAIGLIMKYKFYG